jgi:hypothetical protein
MWADYVTAWMEIMVGGKPSEKKADTHKEAKGQTPAAAKAEKAAEKPKAEAKKAAPKAEKAPVKAEAKTPEKTDAPKE